MVDRSKKINNIGTVVTGDRSTHVAMNGCMLAQICSYGAHKFLRVHPLYEKKVELKWNHFIKQWISRKVNIVYKSPEQWLSIAHSVNRISLASFESMFCSMIGKQTRYERFTGARLERHWYCVRVYIDADVRTWEKVTEKKQYFWAFMVSYVLSLMTWHKLRLGKWIILSHIPHPTSALLDI